MATFPAAAYLSDALRTQAEAKSALEAFLAATRQLPGGAASALLTIASGSITPTGSAHTVGTEGAAIADDLANIAQTNLPDGSLLFLSALSSLQVIIVKHGAGGAGQIAIADAADLSLIDPTMVLVLRRVGTLWAEVGRYYGNQAAALRARYDIPSLTFSPNTFTKTQEWRQGAGLTAAATLALGTDGNAFDVSGTTTITAISTKAAGTLLALTFAAAVQLTHSSNLLLAGARPFVAQVGDRMLLVARASGVWQEFGRTRAGSAEGTAPDPETRMIWEVNLRVIEATAGTQLRIDGELWTPTVGTNILAAAGPTPYGQALRVQGRDSTFGDSINWGDLGISAAPARRFTAGNKNPTLFVRWAQVGTTAGTRFVGLTDGELSADPVNGIYFRHGAAGNIIAVCRAASSESTLDTGVATANGVFHWGRIAVQAGVASVYVDGVLKGTIATTIPTVPLGFSLGVANFIGTTSGLDLVKAAVHADA